MWPLFIQVQEKLYKFIDSDQNAAEKHHSFASEGRHSCGGKTDGEKPLEGVPATGEKSVFGCKKILVLDGADPSPASALGVQSLNL